MKYLNVLVHNILIYSHEKTNIVDFALSISLNMTCRLLRAGTFRLLWIIFCFRKLYLYPPETECVDCGQRRLIRVDTSRRVHNIGFLVERFISIIYSVQESDAN